MRITFALPFLTMTGGIRVVFEHTRQLERLGHVVQLVVPAIRPGLPFTARGRAKLRSYLHDRLVDRPERTLAWYGLSDRAQVVDELRADKFPDADVLIATSWPTAGLVADAPARCGKKAYFLQHYEVFEPGQDAAVDATWRLPLERIVIAGWLARLARERFGVATWGPVINGVNLDQFRPEDRLENDPPVVGMMYELQPWKGVADGFEAIRLARESLPGLRVHLFGRYRLRHALRAGDRYERNPSQERIAQIYRSCDLFLSPSWSEGCQLPPMEAMASGCAVVATRVGGIPDYGIEGRTVLVAEPRDPAALAAHLVRLREDRVAREALAAAGLERIREFPWESASAALERCLVAIAAGERAPS
ncbi:MAG: glycosyltransferase family 4 protein [Candidatus Eisenbacteria bacterium]